MANVFSRIFISKSTVSNLFLEKLKLIVIFIIMGLSFISAPFNIYYVLSNGNILYCVSISIYTLVLLVGLIIFLKTRKIESLQLLVAIDIFLIANITIVTAGGDYGLGTLYFFSLFSIFFIITGFKFGIFMPIYYYVGLVLRLKLFPVSELSIFYDGVTIDRFMVVAVLSLFLGIASNVFFKLFIDNDERLAFTDTLTALPNKNKLEFDINKNGKRKNGFSIIGIKVENLHQVSRNLGAKSGNTYLKGIVKELTDNLNIDEILGRWSGSLFILLIKTTKRAELKERAEYILEVLSRFYRVDRGKIYGKFIMAVSSFPNDCETPLQLVENVNFLLAAKKAIPNDILFFNKCLFEVEQNKFLIMKEINSIDIKDEFYLEYQPKIDLKSGSCFGAEILARWNSRNLGEISPDEFIPIAEECGLIRSLTRWIINQCFKEISGSSLDGKSFAINLSVIDLKDPDFMRFVEENIKLYNIPQSSIEFEITESLLMDDDPQIKGNLEGIINMGISLAVDDFGTGYSSLSYLHKFKVHNLKIDKSFIDHITSIDDYPVIDAIISMAKSLGLIITAEGVERDIQEEYLKKHNCNAAQGWLYSKSLSYKKFIEFSQSFTAL